MHIQTHIVDLEPDKDNIITTRLLVPSSDIECLDGRDASLLEIRRLTGANIQILPREELPLCVAKTDELVQVCDLTYCFHKYPIRSFSQCSQILKVELHNDDRSYLSKH